MSHTYAIADVSQSTYDEVRALLVAAGYQHAIHATGSEEVLDMHGIALRAKPGAARITACAWIGPFGGGPCGRQAGDQRHGSDSESHYGQTRTYHEFVS